MGLALYLHPKLAQSRQGRFLIRLTSAQSYESLPDEGMILVTGEDFQGSDIQQKLLVWSQNPGRSLLLLPPYREGLIVDGIDWAIAYQNIPQVQNMDGIAALLAPEVVISMLGHDGSYEMDSDALWQDGTVNWRYCKRHSASGVLAATTLPIWSIALLGKGELVRNWLTRIHRHAGTSSTVEKIAEQDAPALETTDYTTMVCIYAWHNCNQRQLIDRIDNSPILTLQPELIEASLERLMLNGYLTETNTGITLSHAGEDALSASPYKMYADPLRLEAQNSNTTGSGL